VLGVLGVRDPLPALAVVTAYGFVVRGENATLGLITARYYGRASYGAISGTLVPIGYVGLGIGPYIGSLLYEASHDYTAFWWMLAVLHTVNVLFLGLAFQPKPPQAAPALV
jgi:cyanate permease